MSKNNEGVKIILVATTLVFLVLSFLIVKNYIGSILTGFILVFLLDPLYQRLMKIFKSKKFAAIFMCFVMIFLITGMLFFLINSLISQAGSAYMTASKYLNTHDMSSNPIAIYVEEKLGIDINLKQLIGDFFNWMIKIGQGFITDITDKILGFVVIMFSFFYLLNEKDNIRDGIKKLLPVPKEITDKFFVETSKITHALIFGIFVTGIIQGVVAGIGYLIFGVNSVLFWVVLTTFFAWIPIMGPPFVYVPLGLSMIVTGLEDGTWYKGVLVLLYGFFIVSTVDNIVRPKLVGDKANVNPLIIFVGIIGGIKLFGFVGIIIGPVVLELFFFTINIYFDYIKEQEILNEKELEKHYLLFRSLENRKIRLKAQESLKNH